MVKELRLLLAGLLAKAVLGDDDMCSTIQTSMAALASNECGKAFVQTLCDCSGSTNGTDPVPKPSPGPTDAPQPSSDEPFIGTYYPNWFVYSKHYMGLAKIGTTNETTSADPDPKYTVLPSDLSAVLSKVNTVYYAFHNLDGSCFVSDMDTDASWYGENGESAVWIKMDTHPNGCKGAVNDLMSVKSAYPHLRIMISVGGWTYSKNYSNCAKDEANFKKMYDSYSFYTGGDFGKSDSTWAGIDFDWEHPGAAGLTQDFDAAVDWPNYAKLVKYFRSRAKDEGRDNFLITAAVGVGDTMDVLIKDQQSASAFCGALDHINFMTYDMHGKWEPVTGHNAPFCQIDSGTNARPAPKPLPWSVKDRVNAVVKLCGAEKVNLGIPNYSPAWTGIPATDNGLYQSSTDATSDPLSWATWSTFSEEDKAYVPQGIVHWWDLKAALADSSSGLQVYSKNCPADEGVTVPVKWVYSSSKKIFACYEDPETVQKKVQWAKAKGLSGFFFWDMSQDKTADLVDAGRQGWGFSQTWTGGSKQCHDDARPDFSLQPDGSSSPYEGCHFSDRKTKVPAGQGCAAPRAEAVAACGSKAAIAVGGQRASGGACRNTCTQRWGNGDGVQANDIVYYVCEGEEVKPDGGDDGNNDGGNDGGDDNSGDVCYAHQDWQGKPCAKCSSPIAGQCPDFTYTTCYPSMQTCQAATAG